MLPLGTTPRCGQSLKVVQSSRTSLGSLWAARRRRRRPLPKSHVRWRGRSVSLFASPSVSQKMPFAISPTTPRILTAFLPLPALHVRAAIFVGSGHPSSTPRMNRFSTAFCENTEINSLRHPPTKPHKLNRMRSCRKLLARLSPFRKLTFPQAFGTLSNGLTTRIPYPYYRVYSFAVPAIDRSLLCGRANASASLRKHRTPVSETFYI